MAKEKAQWKCHYRLEKRVGEPRKGESEAKFCKRVEPYEVREGDDNCLLNTGIAELWNLVDGTSTGHYTNDAAEIGVSNDTTAATATQTALQDSTQAEWFAMTTGYPGTTGQQMSLKGSMGSTYALFAWGEWAVRNTATGILLNRKVDALGTKATGTTWTLEVTLTLS